MDLESIRKELYEGETVEPQQMTTEEAIEALKKMGEDGIKKKIAMLLLNKRQTIKNIKQRLGIDSVHLQGFESYGYLLNSEWVKRDGVRCKEYWLTYNGRK